MPVPKPDQISSASLGLTRFGPTFELTLRVLTLVQRKRYMREIGAVDREHAAL
jgi:hypothetical protein